MKLNGKKNKNKNIYTWMTRPTQPWWGEQVLYGQPKLVNRALSLSVE